MSSLEDVYRGESRWRAVARATLVLTGTLVAAVGFVAATASLIAGFGFGKAGALQAATLLGGAFLLGGYLVAYARGSGSGYSRTLAGVGAAVGAAGLVLFWTSLPNGWTGNLAQLPPVALGTYAAGLLAVFGAGVGTGQSDASRDSTDGETDEARRADTDPIGGVESVFGSTGNEVTGNGGTENGATGNQGTRNGGRSDRAAAASAVGDGGEAEDDLQFFDGEDES